MLRRKKPGWKIILFVLLRKDSLDCGCCCCSLIIQRGKEALSAPKGALWPTLEDWNHIITIAIKSHHTGLRYFRKKTILNAHLKLRIKQNAEDVLLNSQFFNLSSFLTCLHSSHLNEFAAVEGCWWTFETLEHWPRCENDSYQNKHNYTRQITFQNIQKLNNYLLEIFASLPCERNLYENTFLFLFFPIGSVEEYFHQVSGAEQTLVRNTRYK